MLLALESRSNFTNLTRSSIVTLLCGNNISQFCSLRAIMGERRARETCVVMIGAGRKGGPCHSHSMNNIKTSGHRSLYWSFLPAHRDHCWLPSKNHHANLALFDPIESFSRQAGQGLILINATSIFCWSIKNLELKLTCRSIQKSRYR